MGGIHVSRQVLALNPCILFDSSLTNNGQTKDNLKSRNKIFVSALRRAILFNAPNAKRWGILTLRAAVYQRQNTARFVQVKNVCC